MTSTVTKPAITLDGLQPYQCFIYGALLAIARANNNQPVTMSMTELSQALHHPQLYCITAILKLGKLGLIHHQWTTAGVILSATPIQEAA